MNVAGCHKRQANGYVIIKPTMNHVEIEAKEIRPNVLIFTQSGWIDFYECYKDFVCKKCGSFDWFLATQNGLHAPPTLPARIPDIVTTNDNRAWIVSYRFKKTVEEYSKKLARFIPIPNQKDHYVFLPNDLIFPPKKVRITPEAEYKNEFNLDKLFNGEPYRADKLPCKACGHYSNLCFRRSLFYVPDDVVLCGIVIDTKSMSIAASEELAKHLSEAKLSGLLIKKKSFSRVPNETLIQRKSHS